MDINNQTEVLFICFMPNDIFATMNRELTFSFFLFPGLLY